MWAWPSLIRYPTRFSDWRVHSCSDNRGSTVISFLLSRLQALQLDPNNDSYRSNLQTVDEQLRTPPAAPNAAAGGGAGAGPDPSAANPLAGEVKLKVGQV